MKLKSKDECYESSSRTTVKGIGQKTVLEKADYMTPLIHDQQVTEDICIQFEVIKIQVGEAKQCPKFDLKKKQLPLALRSSEFQGG